MDIRTKKSAVVNRQQGSDFRPQFFAARGWLTDCFLDSTKAERSQGRCHGKARTDSWIAGTEFLKYNIVKYRLLNADRYHRTLSAEFRSIKYAAFSDLSFDDDVHVVRIRLYLTYSSSY